MRFFISALVLLIFTSLYLTGQGLIIHPGARLVNNGNLALTKDFINDGLFSDNSGTVFFSGVTQTISGTTGSTFNNLTINSGSTTTISTAGQTLKGILLCNGILNTGGNLTLISTAIQTALIDGAGVGQVLGNATMQRFLPSGFGYKYFSSPFQAATVNEFADDMTLGPYTFYMYDENRVSSGWVDYYNPATNPLIPLQGYAVNFGSGSAPNTVDVTGVVNNGNLSVTLYNHNYTYTMGFNLVGNPYPSPIDWKAPSGWTKTFIDDALYFFKASTTDQYGGTYGTYINGVSSDGFATNIIPSMQGFFIHVSNGTYPVTGTLAMDNRVRITDQTHSFLKSASLFSIPLLRLTATFSDDNTSADPVVIYFDEKATTGFDSDLDALKLMNTDYMVPNLYAIGSDGSKLSISALPLLSDELCTVPLGLKLDKDGDIIFKIRDIDETLSGLRIYLSDVTAGVEQDLLPDKEYIVNLGTGEYTSRFFLNLSNITTDIGNNTHVGDLFNIYCSHGVLKAEINSRPGEVGTLRIYNLTGQILFIKKVTEPGYHEFNPLVKDGIYIVSYITGTRSSSKKLFIENR